MSNCFFYAVSQWFRTYNSGGHLIIRKSHNGPWPHFQWSPDLVRFFQFWPSKPAYPRRFPPLLFRGYIGQTKERSNEIHGDIYRAFCRS
jgi:hypothetical protein